MKKRIQTLDDFINETSSPSWRLMKKNRFLKQFKGEVVKDFEYRSLPYSNEFIISFESGKKLYLTVNQGEGKGTDAPEINWG